MRRGGSRKAKQLHVVSVQTPRLNPTPTLSLTITLALALAAALILIFTWELHRPMTSELNVFSG